MSLWLGVGIILVLLLLAAGAAAWWMQQANSNHEPRIAVEINPGSPEILRTTSVRGRNITCTLKLTNVGQAATTVEDVYLDVPGGWRVKMNVSHDGGSLLHGDRPLPCRLGPGESVAFGIPRDVLRNQLQEMGVFQTGDVIRVEVRDVTDTTYTAEFPMDKVV